MRSMHRRKYFIDPSVQGMLVYKMAMYWLLFIAGMFCLLVGFPLLISCFVRSPGAPTTGQLIVQAWRMFWPAIFASALMLPVLMLDIIRASNRFAGPMFRLRNALRDLADGKPVEPVTFRYGDFWCEVADEFNRAAARIHNAQPTPQAHSPEAVSAAPAERSLAL